MRRRGRAGSSRTGLQVGRQAAARGIAIDYRTLRPPAEADLALVHSGKVVRLGRTCIGRRRGAHEVTGATADALLSAPAGLLRFAGMEGLGGSDLSGNL